MKYALVLLALFFVSSVVAQDDPYEIEIDEDDDDESIPDEVAFDTFVKKYGKNYDDSVTKIKRKGIFAKNRKLINAHKKAHKNSKSGYKIRLNKFADYTDEEFNQKFKGLSKKRPSRTVRTVTDSIANLRVKRAIPDSLDYRASQAVTGAQYQGTCGSCFAFAAIAAIESQVVLNKGGLIKLSEQNALDCSYGDKYKNDGCEGGLPQNVFQYFIDSKGVATAASYGYVSGTTNKTGSCQFNSATKSRAVVTSIGYVTADETSLQNDLVNHGPIAVGIDSSGIDFRFYSVGVYYEPNCSSSNLDHAVVVIGYGTNSLNEQFWIIKNSWGTTWGTNGFGKMARNRNNNCGIATDGCYPVIKLV